MWRRARVPRLAPGVAAIPPTLVIGVGGTGARTLSHLRRRWHDRLGDLAAVPALQLLLLDTDTTALVAASRGEHAAALANSDTLALPLRRPQEDHFVAKVLTEMKCFGKRKARQRAKRKPCT